MPGETNKLHLDGVSWMLEGKKKTGNPCSGRNYHYVNRIAGDSSFFQICDELLLLANSSKEAQEDILQESWIIH